MAIIAAAVIAAGTAYAANEKKKAAKEAAKPVETHSEVSPYGDVRGHLTRYIDGFIESTDTLRQNGPQFYQGQMPGGGLSGGTQDAIAALEGIMDSGLGADIQSFISNQMGSPTGLTQQAFDAAESYQPAYYDQLITGLMGGAGQSPYLQQFIESGFGTLGSTASSGGSSGGGGVGINFDDLLLGEPTNDWHRAVLDGEFLNADNPEVAALLDSIRNEAAETYERGVVPQIDSEFNRAGRFGSNAYATAQALANEEYNESVGQQVSGVLNDNFQSERDRMLQAVALLNSLDQTKIGAGVDLAGINSQASSAAASRQSNEMLAQQGMLLEAILGEAGLRMDGMNLAGTLTDSLYGRDNDRLSIMSQTAANDQNYQLGLLGAGNDNLNLEIGALGEALGARASGDASRNSAAWNRWNINNDRFNKALTWDQDTYRDGADFLTRIGSAFPEGSNTAPGTYTPYTDPAVAGALAGGSSYMGGKNQGGG